jgi:hypothetical protein
MNQAWLQVVGLGLDMAGFTLILWEWLLVQRHEREVRAMLAAEARQADGLRHLQRAAGQQSPQMQRHHEMASESRQRLATTRLDEAGRQSRSVRLATVYCGAALVVAGFAAQILAAWPGCCSIIGIVPGG